MKVHLWRWDRSTDEWSNGVEIVAASTCALPVMGATLMFVPHEPLWYGYQLAPPSSPSAGDKPPPRYRVPRR